MFFPFQPGVAYKSVAYKKRVCIKNKMFWSMGLHYVYQGIRNTEIQSSFLLFLNQYIFSN